MSVEFLLGIFQETYNTFDKTTYESVKCLTFVGTGANDAIRRDAVVIPVVSGDR